MHIRLRQFVGITIIALALTACHRTEAIYEVDSNPIPANGQHTLSESKIGELIAQAAISKGWLVEKIKPGELRATINWRTYSAISRILYSKADYSIELISSDNLHQEDGNIHRKYNQRVKALQNAINKKISMAAYSAS